ncbi:hypothetical protein BTA51_27865 [Hahella sp. CCB-MM4]|uniref:hypothetical protein n=1 Tax=Hahella sp. (strain CCB-MM4) TaxID=1926491 RepID=UPI000B9C0693|nr:hypothetical protein [Hahella sp. CCB-MM4]OZG70114.1 hypothetical protein BTA51_27865 [Hahella sp. CCB-MM4]
MEAVTVFSGILRDSQQEIEITDLVSFRSHDASGSFSLQARHLDFLTQTESGLSQLSQKDGVLYMAATPGLLEMDGGRLYFSTRRMFLHEDPDLIQQQLTQWLEEERINRKSSHVHLKQLESELMQRLSRAHEPLR